jgi:hypothetical protein
MKKKQAKLSQNQDKILREIASKEHTTQCCWVRAKKANHTQSTKRRT